MKNEAFEMLIDYIKNTVEYPLQEHENEKETIRATIVEDIKWKCSNYASCPHKNNDNYCDLDFKTCEWKNEYEEL